MSASAASAARQPITLRRVVVGLLVAIVGLSTVFVPWAFFLLVLIIGLAMLFELNALCEIKGQPLEYPVAVFGVTAYVVLGALGLLHTWEGVLLAVVTFASFSIGMYGEQQGYFARTAYTLLAVLYIGKLLTYFIFVRAIPGTGVEFTVYAIVLVALTDIFGMVVGTLIGRHQLTRISPRKTVEGSLGSLAIVAGVSALAAFRPELHLSWWQAAILGLSTSIAAQAGDLAESALKRDVGVKDTGTVIQGHGGVLDRFDSYLFGGMAFFASLHVLGVLPVPQ